MFREKRVGCAKSPPTMRMAAKGNKPTRLYKATIYGTDGTITVLEEAKSFYTLKWMQDTVGGFIEIVPMGEGEKTSAVINEEGRINGSPLNTAFAKAFPAVNERFDGFYGPVIVVSNKVL